ncbi:hypothetical protein TEA_011058 [Camellia sinensis var. sinensis]|uniref:Uncharacterized protein n=1 Tax=Camellia sinensis var. sinensis TaxID=542762 RepID=A0A4S4DT30_CAMSN|nr:hypothetical protein TEA_011058 [Camellia sinensis var. sinensis]
MSMVEKYKEREIGPAPKLVAKRFVCPRLKPLGEKDLSKFVPLRALYDPLKERSKREIELVVKKKERKALAEGGEERSLLKKLKEGAMEVPLGTEKEVAKVGLGAKGGLVEPPIAETMS